MTRSMQPAEMTQALAPAFAELNRLGAPIVHYKVCSTFDSSPTVGSLGPVIELGISTFGGRCIPIVVGAPALGRYCVFGNLFARSGAGSEPHRLDRHPSMSRHPVTPMNEADLRIHLAQQTRRSIGLVDITSVMSPADDALAVFKQAAGAFEIVFIDLLHEGNLAIVGRMLATGGAGRFVIGSSGVESALCAFWHEAGAIGPRAAIGRAAAAKGPILAVCGSCSPVTAAQIEWAARHGFVEVTLDPASPDAPAALAAIRAALAGKQSVVLHTQSARRVDSQQAAGLGAALGAIVNQCLAETRLGRVIVAGGDTSGAIAGALRIESMRMIAELTRGAPLVRVDAPSSPADGIEMVFKGGQIGPVDFFGQVRG